MMEPRLILGQFGQGSLREPALGQMRRFPAQACAVHEWGVRALLPGGQHIAGVGRGRS